MTDADPTLQLTAQLLLTCEHASNAVPHTYQGIIPAHVLTTHRGYDIGAAEIATAISKRTKTPLLSGRYTRLIVDLNRTPGNHRIFSEWTKKLAPSVRENLLRTYHTPHWTRVEDTIHTLMRRGPVLHLAIHSFTPLWKGKRRRADVGVLYDPHRSASSTTARHLRRIISKHIDDRIILNEPYRGWTDGLSTDLSTRYPDHNYIGIELEINQKHLMQSKQRTTMAKAISEAVHELLRCGAC